MRSATAGLWSLLLPVGVAAPSAGQDLPASADVQKLEATWAFVRAERARRLDPTLAQAHYRLAQAYQRTGQNELAAKELEIFEKLKAGSR
jgi:hypothetical protein